MFKEQQLQTFLDQLASRAATPGGGSAAAVMGAMSAALLSMVANLTIGKKNYESVAGAMREMLEQSESLRAVMLDLIQADVEVFDKVMAAYGMARDSAGEQEARAAAIQAALKEAADVPLECARRCAAAINLCRPMAEQGNRNVLSDVGVAVLAARAALHSAALNVYVNIGGIKDEEFAAARRRALESLLAAADAAAAEIHERVKAGL